MKIDAVWDAPLRFADNYNLDLELIPETPAVYVIFRRHGENNYPLYIGRTAKLRRRVKQHLNSRSFISALEEYECGARYIGWCAFLPRKGAKIKKVLDLAERGLILHALSEGHILINIQGARTPVHQISFSGNLTLRNMFGRHVFIKKSA